MLRRHGSHRRGGEGPSADFSRDALELLVGSDPERAPRHINRWGFIAEEMRGADADLLGIMSKSDEESTDEAEKQIATENQLHSTWIDVPSVAFYGVGSHSDDNGRVAYLYSTASADRMRKCSSSCRGYATTWPSDRIQDGADIMIPPRPRHA